LKSLSNPSVQLGRRLSIALMNSLGVVSINSSKLSSEEEKTDDSDDVSIISIESDDISEYSIEEVMLSAMK